MKRVIKFWNKFSEKGFSDCGTEYEVLPILVVDNAGPKELKAIAKQLGIRTVGNVEKFPEPTGYQRGATRMTHRIKTNKKTEPKFHGKEKFDWYIGFVTLNEKGPLKAVEKLGKSVTKDQANQIIEERLYGLEDVGDFSMVPNKTDLRIVMSNWNYYHEIKMLGYDFKKFEKLITRSNKNQDGNREFEDSVFRCDECGTWDNRDDGYNYNYKMTDYEQLGKNCGCAMEHSIKNVETFANNHKDCIDREAADDLENDGKIERIETFIGGWTDGRGGYFKGKTTRSGTPEAVLTEYRAKMPKVNFVFIHEESGQFQSYFTIAKLKTKVSRKAA